jgi:DNA transformation protein and related proteins
MSPMHTARMSTSREFAAHCVELLSSLGPTRSRRMFGGYGFYVDDVFVALAADERLYLKVDDLTRPHFEAAGCAVAFVYEAGNEKKAVMSYYTAPDEALESPALMQPWARWALEAALRARKPARTAAKKVTQSVAKKPAKKVTKKVTKKTAA